MRHVVLSLAAAAALIALPAMAQNTGTTSGSTGSTDTTMGTNNNGTTGSTYDNNANNGGTYDNGTATTNTTTGTSTDTTTGTTTGTETRPGTFTGVGGNASDERTHPAVPTHSNGSALTATGTIVSWNHDELVLHTSNGITHFKMVPSTTGYNGPGTFQEGQMASVDFDRNEQGVLIARQVRLGTMTTATTATTTSEPIATTTTTTDNTASVGVPSTPAPDTTSSTTTTPDTTASTDNTTTTDNTSTTSTRMPATASDSPLVALLGLAALGAAAGLRRL